MPFHAQTTWKNQNLVVIAVHGWDVFEGRARLASLTATQLDILDSCAVIHYQDGTQETVDEQDLLLMAAGNGNSTSTPFLYALPDAGAAASGTVADFTDLECTDRRYFEDLIPSSFVFRRGIVSAKLMAG